MANGFSTIITGSASGIGAELALIMAYPGANLTLHTRSSAVRLNAVAKRARQAGAAVETVLGDLSDEGVGQSIVAAHVARFGQLDFLVGNAGFPLLKSVEEMTLKEVAYAFRGNGLSFFELVQAALPFLKDSSRARIVALGSFTAHVFRTDLPQFPASAASKGSIEVAVRALALALAKYKINVNCVVPGFVAKDPGTSEGISSDQEKAMEEKIPLGRLGRPRDIANAIEFLLSGGSEYITGQIIHVNGGLS